MKGLASVSPFFARVGVSARSARKHYGITSGHPYIEGQHDKSLRSVIANTHKTMGEILFNHSLTKQILGCL